MKELLEGPIYRDTIWQKQNLSLGVLKLQKPDKDIKQCRDFDSFRGIIIYMVILERNTSFPVPVFLP